ncbi:hypothetical protein [Microbacterium sp. NPDC055599]
MTDPGAPSAAPAGPPGGAGHRLPPRFASAPSAPLLTPLTRRRRRRPRGPVVAGVIGAVAVVAALAITQVSAALGFDDASARVETAARAVDAQRSEVDHRYAALLESTDAGHVILDTGSPTLLVPEESWSALTAAVADGEGIGAAVEDAVAADRPPARDKPAWFWELFGTTAQLEDDERALVELDANLERASTDASRGRDAVAESGLAVLATAGQAATAFEAAHVSARNDAVIALRDAAADVTAVTTIDDTAVAAYVALQDAAAQVVATEAAELSEKDGPLRGARLEIEAFARSLAPGVLLEFDWAATVNGAGANGSMGGYTTWWWDEPGRAVIQLSDSVAQQWPADRSKALVAHEVGHAISVKCQGMYDSSTQDSIEKWATAWAISMGFTDDANGVWAYGYPPQNYIDAAAGCR